MKPKYLVDVPKELFEFFSKKYGTGQSEDRKIDDTIYRVQPLNLQTNAWHGYKPWRDEGKSVVTIGLFHNGVVGSMTEVTRFVVWNHIPEVSGVEFFYIWGGIYGANTTRTERVIPRFGNGLEAIDLVVPEMVFIAEVLQTAQELGKNIEPRRYTYHKDIGFVPANEYRYA